MGALAGIATQSASLMRGEGRELVGRFDNDSVCVGVCAANMHLLSRVWGRWVLHRPRVAGASSNADLLKELRKICT